MKPTDEARNRVSRAAQGAHGKDAQIVDLVEAIRLLADEIDVLQAEIDEVGDRSPDL